MIDRFRTWLAGVLAPSQSLPARTSRTELMSRFAIITEAHNLQLGAAMAIQSDLLRQLNEVTALLTAASGRLATQGAAVKKSIAELTAKVQELTAENQRLRDAAASGEASSIEIAAAINALMEAAKKLGAPAEVGAAVEVAA